MAINSEAARDDFLKAIQSVDKDVSGQLLVASPYGFKVGIIDGKKYLICLTKEEFEELKSQVQPDPILPEGTCNLINNGYCVSGTCRNFCNIHGVGGSFACFCEFNR